MRRGAAAAAVVAAIGLAAAPVPSAFERHIDSATIARAIALGRSGDRATLERFHASYTIALGGPLLERLEIVTELRRVVLAAEERAGFGESSWGEPQATAMLRPFRDAMTLVLHVAFPPQNLYRAMPPFRIDLYARGGDVVTARDIQLVPRYLPGQPAPPGSPILGGRVEATFDARRLDARGVYLAGIFERGREVRRVEVDFGRIE